MFQLKVRIYQWLDETRRNETCFEIRCEKLDFFRCKSAVSPCGGAPYQRDDLNAPDNQMSNPSPTVHISGEIWKMSSQADKLRVGCFVCSSANNLLRCARCKAIYYCSREHQKRDWKRHKTACKQLIPGTPNSPSTSIDSTSVEQRYGHLFTNSVASLLPVEGSSESEILSTAGELLGETYTRAFNNNIDDKSSSKSLTCAKSAMPIAGEKIAKPVKGIKYFPEVALAGGSAPFQHSIDEVVLEGMCRNIIQDLSDYGLCVLDNFLGFEEGNRVMAEVLNIKGTGALRDGQLVSTRGKAKEDLKTIRSDKICWVHGKEPDCEHIGYLIGRVDTLITRANRMFNNGKLGQYNINGRTKVSHLYWLTTLILNSKYNLEFRPFLSAIYTGKRLNTMYANCKLEFLRMVAKREFLFSLLPVESLKRLVKIAKQLFFSNSTWNPCIGALNDSLLCLSSWTLHIPF